MAVENVRLVREECLLLRGWALWISFKPQDESVWLKSNIHAHPHYKHIILLRAVSHIQTGTRNCWVMSRLNHCIQVQSQVSHLSSKVSFISRHLYTLSLAAHLPHTEHQQQNVLISSISNKTYPIRQTKSYSQNVLYCLCRWLIPLSHLTLKTKQKIDESKIEQLFQSFIERYTCNHTVMWRIHNFSGKFSSVTTTVAIWLNEWITRLVVLFYFNLFQSFSHAHGKLPFGKAFSHHNLPAFTSSDPASLRAGFTSNYI